MNILLPIMIKDPLESLARAIAKIAKIIFSVALGK